MTPVHSSYQEDARILSLLRAQGFLPKHIYDVGASNAVWSLMATDIFPEATFDLFEPLAEIEERYRKALKDGKHQAQFFEDPRHRLHPMALGKQSCDGSMFHFSDASSSTLLPISNFSHEAPPAQTVKVRTVAELVEKHGFPIPDLIKMDVQGYELDILEGVGPWVKEISVIYLECWLIRSYNFLTPLFSELTSLLHSKQFELFDIGAKHVRQSDGRLTALDCCFVNTRFPCFAGSFRNNRTNIKAAQRDGVISEQNATSIKKYVANLFRQKPSDNEEVKSVQPMAVHSAIVSNSRTEEMLRDRLNLEVAPNQVPVSEPVCTLPLYFNHVPKTAGTAVRLWLEGFFDKSETCAALFPQDFARLDSETAKRYKFFSGHLESLPDEKHIGKLQTFVVLRDPLTHLASITAYNMKEHVCGSGASDNDIRNASRQFIERVWRHSRQISPSLNYQTRYLCGLPVDRRRRLPLEARDVALGYLKSADVVGTTDRLQESLDLLCYSRGWPHKPLARERANTTPSDGVLDALPIDELKCELYADYAIYFYALKRLGEDIERVFGAGHTPKSRAVLINARHEAFLVDAREG